MPEKPQIRTIRLFNIDGHDDYFLPIELMSGSILVDRSNVPTYVEDIFEKTSDMDSQLLRLLKVEILDLGYMKNLMRKATT
ncbi:hypothetical protein WICANDRAFT_71339 [Wickerhamomyces anomalus NRRL Y-366-8]|uniref:Uncharacterized protein n=1 Tax=Wickerhamomyces anomalus (strain ATCC 58044 / CBS 1984 / NCYC 433 / NRRL Y-366-8) TaxID=683960 RepID=A0A1E3NUD8_WICAA|nr:uncharacterized protein WICANDRAFT_71339 [Wickerhamomyces anomalus NRRL Y-366-8]ODQ56799.1 hypothetical protein WICANDRAFT_71339 [Wickerhamomyces anomalus NRRL Y-366-8]